MPPRKFLTPVRLEDGNKDEVIENAEAAMDAQIAALDRMAAAIKRRQTLLIKEFAQQNGNGELVWTEDLSNFAAMQGLTTLIYLAEHGDREAAKWLAEKGLGAVEQSFSVRIADWSADELERSAYHLFIDMGYTDEHARLAVKALGSAAPPLEEGP